MRIHLQSNKRIKNVSSLSFPFDAIIVYRNNLKHFTSKASIFGNELKTHSKFFKTAVKK